MMTKERALLLLVAYIRSDYGAGSSLFVKKLIERPEVNIPIEDKYRIFNEDTETFITSAEEFLTQINPEKVTIDFSTCNSERGLSVPMTVTIGNYKVIYKAFCQSDHFFTKRNGITNDKITFTMSYMNDTDEVHPLKIININMTSQE